MIIQKYENNIKKKIKQKLSFYKEYLSLKFCKEYLALQNPPKKSYLRQELSLNEGNNALKIYRKTERQKDRKTERQIDSYSSAPKKQRNL